MIKYFFSLVISTLAIEQKQSKTVSELPSTEFKPHQRGSTPHGVTILVIFLKFVLSVYLQSVFFCYSQGKSQGGTRRSSPVLRPQGRALLVEGWAPEVDDPPATAANSNPFERDDDELDPILEQINNVRNMLERAQAAGRKDEVVSLRSNLQELKKEHQRQQTVNGFGRAGSRGGARLRSAKAAAPIVVNKNPFLERLPPTSTKRPPAPMNKNPFLESGRDDDVTNPFLSGSPRRDSDGQNPFLLDDECSKTNRGGPPDDGVDDPVFHQICYISKRLDEAIKSGKMDEAAIMRENLKELQKLYGSNRWQRRKAAKAWP